MKEYIFCIDSDGCAMDTMTYKHQLFFGPLAADIFQIKEKESFLKEWNRVNLYSKTRGVNRFVGLVMGLEFAGVSETQTLKNWVDTTSSLSNASLEMELKQHPTKDLAKALAWSNEVNHQIKHYKGTSQAFKRVKASLKHLHDMGKVYIVSSANKEAVEEEWTTQGLMPYVDELYCQDRGKKEAILEQIIASGVAPEQILMIGDSPGDLAAAQQNQIAFYPILVGKEEGSWHKLDTEVVNLFTAGEFDSRLQNHLITAFWQNLE